MTIFSKFLTVFTCMMLLCGYAKAEMSATPLKEGSYGFDWLNPKHASCKKISGVLFKKMTHCEFSASGGFGLGHASHTCKINAKSEYIIFADQKICKDELATMQANGD